MVDPSDRPEPAPLERWFLETVGGHRRDLGSKLARGLLWAAARGYLAGLQAREAAYALRLVRPLEVPARVISVGNLTLGGTGKTPAVAHLARLFRDRGERVAVLIRGHGGKRLAEVSIVHDGLQRRLGVDQVGDEASLLAERLGDVPVIAGKDRRATARCAVEQFDATLLVLDDGFQYRRLAADDQIVLLDATRPFGTGDLFPAGTLRDPPSALWRADQIWLTRCDHPEACDLDALTARLARWAPQVPVFRTVHQPARLTAFPSGQPLELSRLAGRRVAAMAGIGNPSAFFATLLAAGVTDLWQEPFPDHHRYTQQNIRGVVARATAAGCDVVVTTEKDAVRLELWPAGGPELWVLGVELSFVGAAPSWDAAEKEAP